MLNKEMQNYINKQDIVLKTMLNYEDLIKKVNEYVA